MTTALVVDSPTPFAPPVVVKPHEQLTYMAMNLLMASTPVCAQDTALWHEMTPGQAGVESAEAGKRG